MGRSTNENILFKKKNTFGSKILKALGGILSFIGRSLAAIFGFIIEYFFEILFVVTIVGIPWAIISCLSAESTRKQEFMNAVNSREKFINSKYPKTIEFKYELKRYKEIDNDIFHITTLHDSIINIFDVYSSNVTIYEIPNIEKGYVKIYAIRKNGSIRGIDSSIELINSDDYKRNENISWGLLDKTYGLIPGEWTETNIIYDVTNFIKVNSLRLTYDTDESFNSRHYYLRYIIDKVILYVPAYEPDENDDTIEFSEKKKSMQYYDNAAMEKVRAKIQAALDDTIVDKTYSSIPRRMLCYN